MKTLKLMSAASLCLAAVTVMAQEPVWNASAIPYGLGNGWTPGSGR